MMPNNTSAYPKISIITATYNRADFLEATIQSILGQNYPNLEYIVIDGGSTDGTVDIIKQYEDHLAYWVSEPDKGMYHAIQKGFDQATGEIMGWLNSDDLYFDWTFDTLATLFNTFPDMEWLTSNQLFAINATGKPLACFQVPGYSREGYLRGEHFDLPSQQYVVEYIMQEATFWRRSLWDKVGATLDTSLKYAGESELWFRFFEHAELYDVSLPLAQFRHHDNQITNQLSNQYHAEIELLLQKYGHHRHTRLTATLRGLFSQHTPSRLRRLPHMLGLMHKSKRLKYNMRQQQWQIQQRYY
ncbi:MAG: glycosyltransferase family 2 protein [Phototrophicaceae bacterium]